MVETVEIFEMGPRDGLQNEKRLIPAAEKIALVDLLSQAGFRRIEVTSFVSPKWVPQMADAAEVMAGIRRAPGVSYAVLTPNMKGYEGAKAARAGEVAIFASASEGFSKANLNASIAESLERLAPVAQAAQADGIPVRGYVSVVTDCPFDGPTPPANVARVAAALRDMGCYEVSLGDTIGQGRPESIDAMLSAVLQELPAEHLAGHYHDTAGRALENIDASLARGLRVFDAAVGGLGGCPYAPGARGNVATERVAAHLAARGHAHGLDMEIIGRAAAMARAMREGRDV
ncbi:hydroxymethylglutaryl-CoA lyase [Paracoccus siganidrum]|uniref:Hydroxymethylglutaryl-CoA lyase n=1 Tax=Paracoccus siganidrum TaxID=1276757 RepID=A0A419A952_9RHOB|nr:hydroxymethylglutaryl-CoA lyase [Paracoccus siganidrum]RJL19099.1 hydroxymethylglutaryl-CoA lyase [Paracoccus siganidrum]RMC40400.1 hydroxymethylglutaryl-CoA lyase [Paracoccus siganidrum]